MLEINNINVLYGDLQALWDVSITVKKGEIVTLVGSNGSGKSTLMKTITGLLKPRDGTIYFNGIRIDGLPAYRIVERGISMVPEGRRLFAQMSVLENLEVGASSAGARTKRHSTMEWIFRLFPVLKERIKQNAGTLSGGEQQMLAIGRSLMADPELLLIDEMSLGLSPLLAQEIFGVIQDISNSRNIPVFLVEQDISMALSVSHRGYVIENGRIVNEGEAKALLSDTKIKEAYLGIRSNKG